MIKEKSLKNSLQRGFTLVELLVTITIFVVISSIVIFNYGKFNSSVLLTNLAYEVALTVREAQSSALAVQAQGSNFFNAYGVHFALTIPDDKNHFTSYYKPTDPSPPDYGFTGATEINIYTMKNGNSIKSMCVTSPLGGPCVAVSTLDIAFKRPEPKAYIYGLDLANSPIINGSYAEVVLSTSDGTATSTISFRRNGQISVGSED